MSKHSWPSPTPEQWVAYRNGLGLTQTQVGELVCSPRSTVGKWERGERRIPAMAWKLLQLESARLRRERGDPAP